MARAMRTVCCSCLHHERSCRSLLRCHGLPASLSHKLSVNCAQTSTRNLSEPVVVAVEWSFSLKEQLALQPLRRRARRRAADRLSEVRPQERVQRHTMDQIIAAPMLDVPVPLVEEQLLVDAFACYDIQVPEQVVEVPKILIDDISVQTPVREPQLAEHLVEVPTILFFLKQTVDIPVPRGGGRRLQGFLPEQNPTAQSVQLIDIPVPGRGSGGVCRTECNNSFILLLSS